MACITPQQIVDSFIQNTPLIAETIKNMTLAAPNWYRDQLNPQVWPDDETNSMQEIVMRGELPEVEDGFDSWHKLDAGSTCETACLNGCGYNLHTLGGGGFERKITTLMEKDFRTPDYCVNEIQNTRQYQNVFEGTIKNFYNQIDFHKEVNVGQNFLSTISLKAVIDSGGFKFNPEDPYLYRAKGTAVLSTLTLMGATMLYQQLRMNPDVTPFGVSNGMPTYAMVASDEFFSHLYRDDPQTRADIRAAGGQYAMDLVTKYNLTTTIRDMFFAVPTMFPRRFRWDGSNWVRVLPWARGIPMESGSFTGLNPQYLDPSYATHEEIIIHGQNPFTTYYKPTAKTIGGGTDFGPENGTEPGFWDEFYWINPQTRDDPMRRVGYFMTTARIGLKAEAPVYAILVPRPPVSSIVGFYPQGPVCPPEASVCTNVVPEAGCPVPLISSAVPHPITSGRYYITFTAPVDADASDVIQLGLTTGGYLNATVVSKNTGNNVPGTVFEVTISGTVPPCDRFVSVHVGSAELACRANVLNYAVNAADATQVDVILDRPIKADTASDGVTLIYGNGTTASATVVSVDMGLNKWRVDIGSSNFSDTVGGIAEICVPTATDASCPGCTAGLISVTQCTE